MDRAISPHSDQTPPVDRPARSARRRGRSESGQVFVWTAFVLPVLLVAAGLTFDVGNMINVRDELTAVTDATALSAARALHDPGTSESYVRNAAKNVASKNSIPSLKKNDQNANYVAFNSNTSNAAGGDIVLGHYDFDTKTFTRLSAPVDFAQVNAVQVNARLSQSAGTLPLSFGRLVGANSFDTTRTAVGVLGAPSAGRPTVPMAINKDVFTGKTKGFTPPDDITLSTKTNMEWTGFFGGTSSADLKSLVENPISIPKVKRTDKITRSNGTHNAVCLAMESMYKLGDVIIAAVTDFGTDQIVGFVSIQITEISCGGTPKYIDGKVIAYKAGLEKETYAECYGVDCRPFLAS